MITHTISIHALIGRPEPANDLTDGHLLAEKDDTRVLYPASMQSQKIGITSEDSTSQAGSQ